VVGGGLKNHNVSVALFFCIGLIIAQAIQPTAYQEVISIPASSINPLAIWHDDCTNTTGWTEQTSASGYNADGVISGTGGLHAGLLALYVPEIPPTTYNEYGPLFTKEFPNPIAISEILDFRVRLRFYDNPSEAGSLKIYLFDENKKSVFTLGLNDVDYSNLNYRVIFHYNPVTLSPWYAYTLESENDWNDYISFWYNDATETPYTLIGQSLDPIYAVVTNDGEVEVDREITSIGISWTRGPQGEYDGSNLQLREINLMYRQPITSSQSWHHDCSNITQFEQVTEWNPTWWPDRILTLDNISSNGDAIYTPDYSSDVTDWYGPVFVCDLPFLVAIRDIIRFDIQLEFLYSVYADVVRFDFFLFDQDLQPLIRFYFYEVGNPYIGFYFGVQLFDKDLSSVEIHPDHSIAFSLSGTFSLWLSTSAGFFADIPFSKRDFIGGLNSVDADSEVAYFGVVPSSRELVSDIPVYIYDFHLDYVNESYSNSNQTSPNNATITNGNGALFTLPPLEQLLFWAISFGSVIVILTFTIRTIRYRKVATNNL